MCSILNVMVSSTLAAPVICATGWPCTTRARSDDEFTSKLGGALQEADESQLWLQLLREECGIALALTKPLEKESSELMAIFTAMINRTKGKD